MALVGLLALAAWWHVDLPGAYHGPRWMGLWNNPNIYGMLMGVGVVLAIGLLATKERREHKEHSNSSFRFILRSLRSFVAIKSAIGNRQSAILILLVAVFMLGVGLVMSYSRGAWLGAGIGLLYQAWCYGKLKWRYVLPVAVVAAAVVLYLWGSTPDSAPWYVKRADLGRPSAQNRATAWRAGLEIMRDHPLGVGWNQAVSVYGKQYSPPEGGAAALTMNSYLMLGTELGIPALLCLVAYVGLALKSERRKQKAENGNRKSEIHNAETGETHCPTLPQPSSTLHSPSSNDLAVACRAGALVFVVAFWFDGGLFDLPTAALFWVLLELGSCQTTSTQTRARAENLVATNH